MLVIVCKSFYLFESVFNLELPNKGYGQELIETATGHITEQTIHEGMKDMLQRKEKARVSHFQIGHVAAKTNTDKYAIDTSSKAAFNPDMLAQHQRTYLYH